MDGPRPSAGRLEILRDGFWYLVCSYGFDQQDTSVVCRQLGYPLCVLFLSDFTKGISLLKAFWPRWLKQLKYNFVIKAFILKCTINCIILKLKLIFMIEEKWHGGYKTQPSVTACLSHSSASGADLCHP